MQHRGRDVRIEQNVACQRGPRGFWRICCIAACAVLAAALTGIRVAHAASAPAWVQAQVGVPTPEHDEKTTAVLLYSEVILTAQPNGKLKRLDRRVYRILRPDGREFGIVREDVDSQTRVNSLRGWSIPAEGKGYDVGERDVVESSLAGVENGELMSDVRTRVLRIPAATPGSIVGYEVEIEERPYVMTDEWAFEDTVPVRETHYTLQLPPGWSFKASWLNHAEQAADSSVGGRTHWVLRDLRPIAVEAQMPPWQGIAGRLVISLLPPDGQPRGFQSWREMGVWYQGLARGRTEPSPQIKQKVIELTQTAATPLDKMKVLAAFVQNDVRYVAIELGIGGLQPHAATDVFANRYGDCKDKATLLKSMLAEIGVESDYFLINTERGAITATTVPNLGFNHAILAIHLPAGSADPALLAVTQSGRLGRILFFDPTDTLTPFGRLRGVLQSSYGMLVTADGGELLSTPQLPGEASSIQRTAKMTLDETGTLRGDVHETWSGDMASAQRAAARASTQATDRIRPVESVAADSFSSFDILKAVVINGPVNDRPYEWDYTIEAPRYAKTAGDLLLVRPRILGSKTSALLETKEPRRQPIEFPGPERDTDVFEIALPAGYEVDELPPPVSADYGFVAYQSKTELLGHTLRYTRTFEIRELSIPVGKAAQLKQLYRIIDDDERNSAVLKTGAAH
jgi:transglutaminase-like putative cysteine protease